MTSDASGLPLRLPAQHGKEVVQMRVRRALIRMGALLGATAASAVVFGWRSLGFALAEVVCIALLLVMDRTAAPAIDRWRQGNQGEVKVAEALAAAEADGWLALHDVPTGRGNIDHVVVGPGGILTVETKSHRGRLDVDKLNDAWLKQAYAQSKRIERVTGLPCEPLLVFSDAYLSRPVSRQRGVCVLPARMLRGHLARRTGTISHEEARSIHARLARAFAAD